MDTPLGRSRSMGVDDMIQWLLRQRKNAGYEACESTGETACMRRVTALAGRFGMRS